MNREDRDLLWFSVGALAMFGLMIFLYQDTTAQKLDISASKAKEECEALLPRNISCEIVITAVPKEENK